MNISMYVHTNSETRATVNGQSGYTWLELTSGTVNITLHEGDNGLSAEQLRRIAAIISERDDT